MSAREIIAEIEALPKDQKAKVVDYIRNMPVAEAPEVSYADDAAFQRAKRKVFSTHAPLLKKLVR